MSETNSTALLSGKQLAKNYRNRRVLNGVDIEIHPGETVGLLGPNGAGKSTCFYILSGLIKPTGGSIIFEGVDITTAPIDKRARLGIGLLPQERSVFTNLNVKDNLRAVLEICKEKTENINTRSIELLEKMRIGHLANEPVINLSGGETRRLEIARALVMRPRVLMLDEPFAAIDPITVGDLNEALRELQNEGISLLISDHNVREALSICNRAYILFDGSVLCSGTPDEIASNEQVRDRYLGSNFLL